MNSIFYGKKKPSFNAIDRFQRIVDLAEQVRRIDLLTVQALTEINKQTAIMTSSQHSFKKEAKEEAKEEKGYTNTLLDRQYIVNTNCPQKNEVEMNSDVPDSKQALNNFIDMMAKANLAPGDTPTPPAPPAAEESNASPTTATVDVDFIKLQNLARLSANVAERIKTLSDINKHIESNMNDTHRMSYELWKDIDGFLSEKREKLNKNV